MDATYTLLEQYGTPVSHTDAILPIDSDGILTKHLPAPEILGKASDGSSYFLVQYAASSVNFTEDDFEEFFRKFCSRVFRDQGRYLLSLWPVWIDRTLLRDAYDLPDPSVQPWQVFHRTVDDPDGLHKLLLALASEQHQDLHTATLTSIDQWTRVTVSPKDIWKLCEYDRSISVLDQGNDFLESLVLGGCFAFVRLSSPRDLHRSTSHATLIYLARVGRKSEFREYDEIKSHCQSCGRWIAAMVELRSSAFHTHCYGQSAIQKRRTLLTLQLSERAGSTRMNCLVRGYTCRTIVGSISPLFVEKCYVPRTTVLVHDTYCSPRGSVPFDNIDKCSDTVPWV